MDRDSKAEYTNKFMPFDGYDAAHILRLKKLNGERYVGWFIKIPKSIGRFSEFNRLEFMRCVNIKGVNVQIFKMN